MRNRHVVKKDICKMIKKLKLTFSEKILIGFALLIIVVLLYRYLPTKWLIIGVILTISLIIAILDETAKNKNKAEKRKPLLNGKSRKLYENGKLKEEIDYVNGRIHGKQIEYYENGRRKRVCEYVNGLPHGKEVEYYRNGRIRIKNKTFWNMGEIVDSEEKVSKISKAVTAENENDNMLTEAITAGVMLKGIDLGTDNKTDYEHFEEEPEDEEESEEDMDEDEDGLEDMLM